MCVKLARRKVTRDSELKDVLDLINVKVENDDEFLSTEELRVRWQSLVTNVFTVIAEVRMLALVRRTLAITSLTSYCDQFLDDLHVADDSSLDLITALSKSRSSVVSYSASEVNRQS